MSEPLILGTQFYMGLKYHIEDAYKEKGLEVKGLNWSPSVAKFARAYYNDINDLNHDKKYDYCFIGSINSCYAKINKFKITININETFPKRPVHRRTGTRDQEQKLIRLENTPTPQCPKTLKPEKHPNLKFHEIV